MSVKTNLRDCLKTRIIVAADVRRRTIWSDCGKAIRLLTPAATVFNRCAAVAIGLVCAAWPVIAEEVKITLPSETNHFKPGPGSEIAASQCVLCHSADYISTQPPMPRAFWKAGVQKMQKVYGAPLPDAQVERLVEYLVKNYGDEKPGGKAPPPSAIPTK